MHRLLTKQLLLGESKLSNNSEIRLEEDEINLVLSPEEKLKIIMKKYGNDVMRISYIYLKNTQMAEDVTQDVFLKCYENLNNFRNESSYKTWIVKITVNRCKDVLRSWHYRNLSFIDYFYNKNNNEISSYNDTITTEDEISNCVLKLPVKLREVIILFYYQDLTISEITEITKLNSNTVKTRLHRGRQKLKKLIIQRGIKND